MATKGSFGSCQLCGARKSKAAMRAHLEKCLAQQQAEKPPGSGLLQVRVQATGRGLYWLDLEVRQDAKISALDSFLRRIWLECCGHLSAFEIGGVTYAVVVDRELGDGSTRSMDCRIGDVLSAGLRFGYEYDFGSTTTLTGHVYGTRNGSIGRLPVRLLARNEPPVWPCEVCGEAASVLCVECVQPEAGFYCRTHAGQHECGEDMLLPVVNSPRMGVCGYTGED